MKKMLAMLLATLMVLSMVACGTTEPAENKDTTPETTVAPTTEATEAPAVAESALEILETVWAMFGEDQFYVIGDFDAMVDGAPGKVAVGNVDFLTGNLIVPAEQTANITDVASLIHGMNANTFTCAAYAVADAQAFATAMQTAIQGNQWMCGFPEKLMIAEVGGYVVVAFGHGDAVNPFQANLVEAYPTANILIDEAIG